MNAGTIIVCLAVAGVVGLIIRGMIRDKKAGKGGCGCGCEACGNSEFCHQKSD